MHVQRCRVLQQGLSERCCTIHSTSSYSAEETRKLFHEGTMHWASSVALCRGSRAYQLTWYFASGVLRNTRAVSDQEKEPYCRRASKRRTNRPDVLPSRMHEGYGCAPGAQWNSVITFGAPRIVKIVEAESVVASPCRLRVP